MSHAEFLRAEDGDPTIVEAVTHRRWRELPTLTPRQLALCTVAPTRMVELDWQPLRDLGFDDVALLEVGHIVGIFNYLTRLADGFGLQLDHHTIAASETGVALRRPAEQAAQS